MNDVTLKAMAEELMVSEENLYKAWNDAEDQGGDQIPPDVAMYLASKARAEVLGGTLWAKRIA